MDSVPYTAAGGAEAVFSGQPETIHETARPPNAGGRVLDARPIDEGPIDSNHPEL